MNSCETKKIGDDFVTITSKIYTLKHNRPRYSNITAWSMYFTNLLKLEEEYSKMLYHIYLERYKYKDLNSLLFGDELEPEVLKFIIDFLVEFGKRYDKYDLANIRCGMGYQFYNLKEISIGVSIDCYKRLTSDLQETKLYLDALSHE